MTHYIIKSITGAQGQLLFRGLPFGYFDRSGHIPIWNVINTMRDTFNCVYNHGYIDHARLTENKTLFAVRVRYLATEDFHAKAALFNPISFECTTGMKSVGQSSFVDSVTMTETETGTLFVKLMSKFILICNDTKKPVPLPDWFAGKYSIHNSAQELDKLGKEPPMIVPKQVFSHKLQTRHSDLDSNGHIATQEYFRFCMEGAMEASKSGFYRQFVSEIWLFPVLEADVTLLSPISERTELTIFTWQCESNAAKIYFLIMRGNDRIFECSFLFSDRKLKPISFKL
ncbi:uncharacterized protein LOC110461818 [Mizuhopecten yessoensis]|uniref:uncharacterized protein LOC110461818 n=1 Tax=Mizuhopecten yessoensis TaxID=6573 RepID=UPI000B45DD04|nr:uncharacterized protein LOC110461818 [Mizuhopecten yessoensis]XP_021371179.1 uncharacterized protein LOC110461818 [Mizuhopecten yessoensis]